jgi:hypothetical protein
LAEHSLDTDLPIPPLEMRELVGPTDDAAYGNPSRAPIYGVPAARFDPVLEFGCGCGRWARQMTPQHPRPRCYVGFDLYAGMIRWCHDNLEPRAPGFNFVHHDVDYAFDPGNGKPPMRPMPAEDGSVSLLIAVSVFTHLVQPTQSTICERLPASFARMGRLPRASFCSIRKSFR